MADHPLERKWVAYAHFVGNDYVFMRLGGDYTVSNLKEFWRTFAYFSGYLPSLPNVQLRGQGWVEGFSLFEEGVLPQWEDPSNKDGGEVVARGFPPSSICEASKSVFCGLVGEHLGDEVTGVRVILKSKKRVEGKVEVWHRSGPSPSDMLLRLRDSLPFEAPKLTHSLHS